MNQWLNLGGSYVLCTSPWEDTGLVLVVGNTGENGYQDVGSEDHHGASGTVKKALQPCQCCELDYLIWEDGEEGEREGSLERREEGEGRRGEGRGKKERGGGNWEGGKEWEGMRRGREERECGGGGRE